MTEVKHVLLLTGGSRGIGRAVVTAAAASGWNIAFTYNTQAAAANEVIAECRDRFPNIAVGAWRLDVRDPGAVKSVIDAVILEFSAIQAVVCNSGINIHSPAFALSDADWAAVLETNLSGSFYVCRSLLPHFVSQRHGRIVLMGSSLAAGGRGQIAYAASKSALAGMAGTLAKEYGSRGITANVVAPGLIDTGMAKNAAEMAKNDYLRISPAKRLGRAAEVAAAILFVISDQASYINGQCLAVTGGLDWAP